MKKINIIRKTIVCFGLLFILLFQGCSDYLDRPELNRFDDENYWKSENNVRLFVTEFYPQFFVGYNSSWTLDYSLFKGYMFSDDVVQRGTQTAFETNVPTDRGSGNNTLNTNGVLTAPAWQTNYCGPTWYFGWIRKANLMIDRIENRMQTVLTPEQSNHWIAVGRFFKALDYCRLVSAFGDVPYFEKNFSTADVDIMYKDRMPRGEVMDAVYDDFKYVLDNMRANDGTNVLNRNIAAAFISRWMLFEGTWQKYHNGDNARAQKYLQFAVDAANILMTGQYAIDKPVRDLFGSESLVGNKECIMYRIYDASQSTTHCVASYNVQYESQDPSANLNLVKAFLCSDGNVWQNSSVANANKFDLANLKQTRDPRFEAYFMDHLFDKAASLLFTTKFVDRVGPTIPADQVSAIPKYTSNTNTNDAPVIRYGEVLLNWIEAKAELATLGGSAVTQDDINKSINVLRDRPLDDVAIGKGVVKLPYMTLATLPNDPARDADVPQLIWEIRRERRIELYMEPARLLDIKRWKKLDYMQGATHPDILKGIWVNLPVELPSAVDPLKKGITHIMKEDGTVVTFDGTNAAAMVGYYLPDNVADREVFSNKSYCSPVGQNQINLYANWGYTLSQTTGW
ncbi:hypothetical protein FACS1894169_01700 [Bacteroidia bacterium]|nr:hypothetical protein FACS1894169_01700 [Bacteroidia bacterium]